jgi:hypothetical protein
MAILGPLNLLCRKARQRGTYQLAMGARRLARGLGVVGGLVVVVGCLCLDFVMVQYRETSWSTVRA